MNKKKWTSLLMILALLLTLLPAPELSAMAEGGQTSSSGMEIKKTATPNGDGTYTITLEAYATGSKVISEVKKDIPTDIILVLDQSGSMDYNFEAVKEDTYVSYGFQKNSENFELRHNNSSYDSTKNLYYKLNDGGYAQVSVTRTPKVIKDYVEYNTENYNYNNSNDTLYAKTDEGYKIVSVSRSWNTYTYTYTYTLNDGTVVTRTSNGWKGNPPYTIYKFQDITTVYIYKYSYTKDGETTIIGEQSEGDNTVFNIEFYQYVKRGSSVKRLSALKSAVTAFANAVAKKAAGVDGKISTTDDNINHRIAVVGFASQSGNGNNTELLSISGWNSDNVGVAYNNISDQNLKDVLQSMDTTAGQKMVTNAINALAANGATRTDLGVDMAERILGANPVGADEKRNRVVIVFTDGVPTSSSYYDSGVASDAISYATSIKNAKATVYTIGIFSGADATSAGNQNSNNDVQKANWFMQQVSSNNGTPQSPSYYLSAGDSGALNNIFQQISSQIETGGSSTTLDESTVIKDIISPSFVLPDGTTADGITLETYKCTGKDEQGNYTWKNNNDAMGATATITVANITEEPKKLDQVNVTGFNFSENWCGTETVNGKVTYRGNKLVIKITVKPRPGFFGGNGVTTNTSAGIYENENAEKPTFTFDQPKVDVPLANVNVDAPGANVYLGAHLNESVSESDVLKNGATVKIGDSRLDFSQDNYGLEPWRNEYVNIEASVSTSGSFENMTEDAGYTVAVKVTPKTLGGAVGKEASASGTIHVFKPELTFKDSEVSYMANIANYNYNQEDYVKTKWRHQDEGDSTPKYSTDEDVTMLGNAQPPELTYEYTPDATRLTADKEVKATDYVPVAVKVKLGKTDVTNKTTFVHQCGVKVAGGCQWNDATMTNDTPAFLLHVIKVYGDLTITKTGLNKYTYSGGVDRESAIFKVENADKTESWIVAINGDDSVTLTGLKVGSYTVTELNSWTWRYADQDVQTKTVVGDDTVTAEFKNEHKNQQWLGGDNYANNVFASATGN